MTQDIDKERADFGSWRNDHVNKLGHTPTPADAWKARAALAPQWQPIETAPKDGSCFLTTREGWVPLVTQWDSEFGVFDDGHRVFYDLTHWMPLPPPPEQQKDRAQTDSVKIDPRPRQAGE